MIALLACVRLVWGIWAGVLWAADDARFTSRSDWMDLLWNVFLVGLYGFLGLAFFAIAYFIIDKMTPFSFHKEVIEEKNVALAVLLGSLFIGIALILAAAIRGS
jgi:hypothetical protein